MTTIDTDRLWFSSGEIAERAGLPIHKIVYWTTRCKVIRPSVIIGAGSGEHHCWSELDLDVLRAIAVVRADLANLGCPMPVKLVGELWDGLHDDGRVDLDGRTISLHVEL